MTSLASHLTRLIWTAIGGDVRTLEGMCVTGSGGLPSMFPVSDCASAAVGTAALSVAELIASATGKQPDVTIDRRLASIWFGSSIRPIGWDLPAPWDPIAGDYQARDGWIRLHTNAAHHRAAAERVLGRQADKAAMGRAVAEWSKADLESAVIEAGGCAAEMRSIADWQQHDQGRAIAAEPLVAVQSTDAAAATGWSPVPDRPLRGIRVLDLTRVLAGPVASRFLAGYGADVLRIDSPGWNEPAVVPEMTLGKRCARLDLRDSGERRIFGALLAGADILFHGYRPGALEGLGFGTEARRKLAPGLIDVSLDAYGWSGPWKARRGFDSLVQMSTGIAECGMRRAGAPRPVPLPVQALDHMTGYMMAAAAIRGVTERLRNRHGIEARASLARTAKLMIDHRGDTEDDPLAPETADDRSATIEATEWGPAQRIVTPVAIAGTPMRWDRPAGNLGTSVAAWMGEENRKPIP
jgi:hypothetical protein